MRQILALALLVGVASSTTGASQQAPPEAWHAADAAVERLPPSDFHGLPPRVREALEQRGCRIPQTWVGHQPGNVVNGRFSDAGTDDWAALCSRDNVSRILVFWNGDPASVATFAERPDRDFLQVVSPGKIGFSREISLIDPEAVRTHYEWYSDVTPPSLTHDGIDDAFAEKGSVVWYWQRGAWAQLLGSNWGRFGLNGREVYRRQGLRQD